MVWGWIWGITPSIISFLIIFCHKNSQNRARMDKSCARMDKNTAKCRLGSANDELIGQKGIEDRFQFGPRKNTLPSWLGDELSPPTKTSFLNMT